MKKLYKIQLFLFFSLFITTLVKSQCTAGFNLTQNAGGNVTFTSTSTGTNASTYYQWNFGDATSANGSGLTTLSHTYPTNGNYTITLTINNFSICTSTYTQAISVTNSPCTVAINSSFTYTTGATGNVNFTSTSTGTNISSTYLWDFGDGNTSTTMNPSHTYTSNGSFITSLTVANGACSDSSWSFIPVSTVPCSLTPSFTSSTTTSSGQIYFVSTSTGTVTGTTYSWDFGDGSPFGSGNPVFHSYASNGTYTVSLMVTNPSFSISTCTATITNTVLVSTSPCSTAVNASFTYTNTGGGNVNFTSTSTGTTVGSAYSWNFGDGNTSAIMNPSNTYTTNGNYAVQLKVTSGTCSDSVWATVPISTLPCTITPSFTYSNTSSGQIYFVSTSTGTSTSTSYVWNFGDGNFGYSNPIYHNYATNGTYTVILTLSNTFSTTTTCSASTSQTILITTSPCSTAINASFTYTNTGGGNVNFTSTSTGTNVSTTYNWNFGDSNTSTVMNPSHNYGANGNYFVSLYIANGTCTDTTAASVLISGLPCAIAPSFTFANTSSGQLYFTSTSTGVGPGASYYWDFGDSSYGFTNPVYHTYASNGSYSVTLVVTNSPSTAACSASITIPVSVTTTSCVANPSFYLSKSTSTTTNLWFAYPTFPANITNAVWTWGDATSSTGLYPTHIYASTGWYNICLTVTVNCATTGSMCVLSNIYRVQAEAGAAGIAQINVINTAIGITENASLNSSFNLFPNPNNGIFSLAFDSSYNNESSVLVISNMLGEIVYKTKYEKNETLIKEIDLTNISNGAYIMQLNTSKGNFSKKLIINK